MYHVRFTLATNSVAHTLQFSDNNLILCWSRIRKFVTHREHTDRQIDRQTDREFNYRGHSNPRWIVGLSRLINIYKYILKQTKYRQAPH